MRIVFLNLYSGINNRGAESFAHELARRLSEKHEVKFFKGSDYEIGIDQPTQSETILKRFFLDAASISVLKFTLKIFAELWRGNYDWIVPMNGFWQVLLCKLIIKSKILITGHSGPGWDERWNLYLKPDVFVATTEPTAKWARNTCFYTKVVTVPYAIEPYKNIQRTKINLERPIVLCPAAAVPYKRVDLAIKAVAKMGKGSLLHLGTGSEISHIKSLGEKLLGKNFLSVAVSYDQMPSFYVASDVVTLPSTTQENSPMVFLEAMAAGKMVIATPNPRSEWILGENGLFVDPQDTQRYADALQDGLTKKINPKELERFSWSKVLGDYLEIFSKIN